MSFPARLPGESNPNARLNEDAVLDIRELYGRLPLRVLATAYEVSCETIRQIGLRRTWKHLPEEP